MNSACDGHTCTSGPNKWTVPSDPSLPVGVQTAGDLNVFNGFITGVSYGSDVINGGSGNTARQLILTGRTDAGGGDV